MIAKLSTTEGVTESSAGTQILRFFFSNLSIIQENYNLNRLYDLPVATQLLMGEQSSQPLAPNFVFFKQNISVSNPFLLHSLSNSLLFSIQLPSQIQYVQRILPLTSSLILLDNDTQKIYIHCFGYIYIFFQIYIFKIYMFKTF